MSINQIANISNTQPILQQERSKITTNPFIPNEQKTKELQELDKLANDVIEEQYNKNQTTSISNLSIKDITKNISSSFIGFFNDLFTKPKDISWTEYLQIILKKDQRQTYIGVLFILIAFYMLIVNQ
jgi:hypothetical protein